VRSPLLIRWPGKIEAGKKIPQIAGAIDLLPTLADLAGIRVAGRKPLDGISLKPLLVTSGLPGSSRPKKSPAETADLHDRMIFSHWRNRVSVRTQRYRLDHQGKLYDMTEDPGQHKDISEQKPGLAARLSQAAKAWRQEVLDGYDRDERPFLIGHPDYRYTQLPARDGTAHGNIKRSNRFPPCSFFTNWTSLDDKITWETEVAASGAYEVAIHYTCSAGDVGSTIELQFNNSRLAGQITQAHNPPLRGGEHDRVERQESYVKDFRSMKLGTIHLKKGKGELVLRALEIPGSQVMDFRLMMLTRVGP
jgi:hypothetical protein